ncbi:MAG: sulfatase [Gammaproteobacteria bacterium]|nr:sulfatase [Gammaproteobacteria bacterium]
MKKTGHERWGRILLLCALLGTGVSSAGETRPNVLFIAVDDLNHWVSHLDGHPGTRTPNIDRLAGEGVTFSRAYAAAPLCNPSRVSLLTGVMPAHSGVYGNYEELREQLPDAVTLPQYFRRHGYSVTGAGKIFHRALPGDDDAWDEYFASWKSTQKEPSAGGATPTAGAKGNRGALPVAGNELPWKTDSEKETSPQKKSKFTKDGMWAPWGPVDTDDSEMIDAQNADRIIAELESEENKPFFLAYGTHQPHLSWEVPRKYFEMHPRESVVLPKVIDNDLDDIPPFGRRLAAEVLDISNDVDHAAPGGDHANVLKHNQWEAAVQGYLAAISFADAQVGRVLDALAESPHADNTIVALWGDHGYHLGQKEHWRKHTLWEDGLRTTLVISAPGIAGRNGRSDRVVSLLDLYPTLVELAGLDPREGMEGQSIVPLLKQPDLPWSRPAVSTYGFQNHSLRTERWRYIRYHDGTEELYDHDADPYEWTNLAVEPVKDEYREVMNQLAAHLPEVNVPAQGP